MNSTLFICLVTLWGSALAYQVNERESLPPKLHLRPGDLLKSLDELTSDAQVIYSPLQKVPNKSADRRVSQDENQYENSDPDSEYEYDKAYEDFVSKYFAQGEDDLRSEDEDEKSADVGEAVPYDAPDDTDEVNEPKLKKKSSKSKKCERVEIDDQNCVICEDLKTNEKSKSCSYSSESKPKSYSFSRERSRKRSKDDENDDGEASEGGRSLKRDVTSKKDRIQPRRTSIKAFVAPSVLDETSKCVRKKEDGLICYYCGTTEDNTRECMNDKVNLKKRRLDESVKKDSTTKKVFKRMVTYSYKNDAEPKIKESTIAVFKGY